MGRIMGLDIGSKRIGIALSDRMYITAQGLESYTRQEERDVDYIADLVLKYDVERIVCGLPLHMNGDEGLSAEMVRAFAAKLEEKISVPICFCDERLTTMQAERMLIDADVSRKKRRQVVDKMAAVLILQSYLESH